MSPFYPWRPRSPSARVHTDQPAPRRIPLFRKRDDWALWADEFSARARRRWARRTRRLR